MKFFTLIAPLSLLPALARSVSVSYDRVYDNADQSLATVACSDGANGMLTRGFTTFSSLPTFPHIGGAPAIAGYNSPNCGSCWRLTYRDARGRPTSIIMTAIDVAKNDFNIGLTAMNELTNNQAVSFGRVPITAVQIPASNCGL